MTHSIDQTGAVKRLFMQQRCEVIGDFSFVVPMGHLFLHILNHLHHLDVGASVLRPFERAQ